MTPAERVQSAFLGRARALRSRWSGWRDVSLDRQIFAALLTVGAYTVLVKAVAAAKDLVVAMQFGTGDELDAFIIAFSLPSFAMNVVAGSLNAAFIPTYIQVREKEGPAEAQRLLSTVMFWCCALLLVVSFALALASPVLIRWLGSGFSPTKLNLTRRLFLLLLPVLCLGGISTLWAAVLNAGERFAVAAGVPVLTPLVTLLALLLFPHPLGVYALAFGMVIGMLGEAAVLGLALRRRGIVIRPRRLRGSEATRTVLQQYGPMAAGALLMSGTAFVDQIMSAALGAGSVSALSYGSKLPSVLSGVGALAVGTAALPYLSRLVANREWGLVRQTLRRFSTLVAAVTVPLSAALILLSRPIVRLWFERGAFTPYDTATVSAVQMSLLLQMPFFIVSILYVRLLSSLKANNVVFWGSCISLITNAVFNLILMRWWGVAGIALSTSLVYFLAFLFLGWMGQRRLRACAAGRTA